jgi:gliding motility-associated-like protein
MKINTLAIISLLFIFATTHSFSQVVNTTPVNLVGSSDPIPGPGGFIGHPFTPSPLTGTYHGGVYYGATKEKWGYEISGLTPGDSYTLTVYYMMDEVFGVPALDRVGNLTMQSGAPLSAVLIPYVPPADWRTWYTLSTEFTALGTTDRIDIEADGLSDNSLWLFTDMAIDGGGDCDDLSVTVSTDEICLGESFTLDATSDNGGTITWDGGLSNGVAFTPVAAGTFTFEATSTSLDDCPYDIDITVHDLPNVIANADDDEVCLGESITLTGSGATAYVWDGGVTDAVTFSPLVTTTYTVTGTDVNGCTNSDAINITVNPIPLINAGTDQSICLGENIILNGSGAGPGATYIWDGGVTDGVSFSPVSSATYTLTGISADGCQGTDEVEVNIYPNPVVAFDSDLKGGCAPVTIEFTSPSAGTTYEWNFGDGFIGTGTPVTHIYSHEGSYDVTLKITSADGCSNTMTMNEFINVVPQPEANFIFVVDENSEVRNTVSFRNTSLNATNYEWNFGDGTPNEFIENPTHDYPVGPTQSYEVWLTATNDFGCLSEIRKIVTIKEKLLYFIPNTFTPDGDLVNNTFKPIFISGLDVYNYHLVIYNRWGEIVFESYDANIGWDGNFGDGELVIDGSYVWKIEFGETMSDKLHVETGNVNILK